LIDHFVAANWSRPEAYLQESIRAGISSFAQLSLESYEKGLHALERDLKTGEWDKRHGALRSQQEYDAGYRFLTVTQ